MSPKLLPSMLAALGALTLAAAIAAPTRPAKPVKHLPPRPAAVPASPAAPVDEGAVGLVMDMDKNAYAVPAAPIGTRAASAHAPQIHATLTFFNHSQTPLRLAIGGAPTQWLILDDRGQTVWDYSVGRAIPHNIRMVTLTASQLVYAQDIPLQTQDGAPLAPGRYTLRGAIPGAQGATASLDFTVTR